MSGLVRTKPSLTWSFLHEASFYYVPTYFIYIYIYIYIEDFRVNDFSAMLKGRKVIRVKALASAIEILEHMDNKEKNVIISSI